MFKISIQDMRAFIGKYMGYLSSFLLPSWNKEELRGGLESRETRGFRKLEVSRQEQFKEKNTDLNDGQLL